MRAPRLRFQQPALCPHPRPPKSPPQPLLHPRTGYSINSILYQRGVYPPSNFTQVPKYGLTMLVTNDSALQEYMNHVLKQIRSWLMNHQLQKLVIAVSGVDSGETLERWAFELECDKEVTEEGCAQPLPPFIQAGGTWCSSQQQQAAA